MQAVKDADTLKVGESDGSVGKEVERIREAIFTALCDDLNTPIALSYVYEVVKIVNNAKEGRVQVSQKEKESIQSLFKEVVFDILGLLDEDAVSSSGSAGSVDVVDGLMQFVIKERKEARANKDWAKSDQIRDALKELGIQLKDNKDGSTTWEF